VEPTWTYLSTETRRIAEGEGGFEVVVSLSPLAPQGEFEEELWIYLNNEGSPSKTVPVYIRVGGEVVVVPEHLSFRASRPGESVSGRLRVAGREGTTLEILRVESDLPWVATEVVTLEKGRVFEIVVTLRPKKAIDERRSEIHIFTNHPEQSVIAVPLFFYRFR